MEPKGISGHGLPRPPQESISRASNANSSTNTTTTTKSTMISTDKNLMPSMVARLQQQQQHQSGSAISSQNEPAWPPKDLASCREPASGKPMQPMFDQDGLVLPRRVLYQPPCPPVSQGGQQPATIRDLNRELKFNQIQGKNVLDQKSELKKAMERLEANRKRKEAEQERLTRRTSLELRLEERAERIARESATNSTSGQLANVTIQSSGSR